MRLPSRQLPLASEAVEAHRALLEAIQAGDGERAADTMRAHVQNFEQAMHRVLLTV